MMNQILDLSLERLARPVLVVVTDMSAPPWPEIGSLRNLCVIDRLPDTHAFGPFAAAFIPPGSRSEVERRVRLVRGDARLALTPIIAFSGDSRTSIDGVACDAFVPGMFDVARLPGLVASISEMSGRVQQLPRLSATLAHADVDEITVLRFSLTRQLDWLEPVRDVRSPCGYSHVAVSAILRSEPGAEFHALRKLVDAGKLAARFADKVHTCPFCDVYQINFRQSCRSCGTANIWPETAIHHYRCAYVGSKKQFESSRGLACPKCRRDLLHVGVEYEEIAGAFVCSACHATFSDPPVECLCLNCGRTFEPEQAKVALVEAFSLTPAGREAAIATTRAATARTTGQADWVTFCRMLKLHRVVARRHQRPCSILRIRFLGLRQAETTRGVVAVDAMLRQAISELGKAVRDSDVLGRRTPSELLLLMPETPRADAAEVAARLWGRISTILSDGLRLDIRSFHYDGTRTQSHVRFVA